MTIPIIIAHRIQLEPTCIIYFKEIIEFYYIRICNLLKGNDNL